jgi:hypothetical protein
MTHYHHTVLEKSTPPVEFTVWCSSADNKGMESQIADIRRHNLTRLISRDFSGNRSEMARAYDSENPKPQYFSDLLRASSGKSFGEKVARKIEERVGLQNGQLDIPNSPLLFDDLRRQKAKTVLRAVIEELTQDEQVEALSAIRKIQARRRRRA